MYNGIGSYGEGDNAGWNPRGNGTGSNINVGEEMVLIGGIWVLSGDASTDKPTS